MIIKLENLDVGFGIDILRLEALKVEVLLNINTLDTR